MVRRYPVLPDHRLLWAGVEKLYVCRHSGELFGSGECRYAFRIHEGDDRQAGTDMNLWEYDTTLRNFTRFRIRRAWVKTPRPSTSTSCGRCTTEPWRRASAHNSIRSNTSKRASPRPRSGPWHSMRFDKSETCNWRIALKWNMPGICSCRTSTCAGCRS